MQRNTWCVLVAIVAPAALMASQAVQQARPTQAVRAEVKELATIAGVNVRDVVRLPKRDVLLYSTNEALVAYDMTAKQSTPIARGEFMHLRLSPQGDRVAWTRPAEGGRGNLVWAMPIDPHTGATAGAAQRVTVSHGVLPEFSADGKLLSFAAQHTDGKPGHDLATVPVTGGPERVLAKYERTIGRSVWSSDGSSIFVSLVSFGAPVPIERVPVAGGASEKVISYSSSRPQEAGLVAMDGRVLFFRPDQRAVADGRMSYITRPGDQGNFVIPPSARVSGGFAGGHALLTRTLFASTVHVVTLADGKARVILPQSRRARFPVFSPDARRIAVQDFVGEQPNITVMNADGSGARRYSIATPNLGQVRWSPDGRMLAYGAGLPPDTIAALDLASGNARVVASAAPDRMTLTFAWRADSKAIVYSSASTYPEPHSEVLEATLAGGTRRLRDLDAGFPDYRPAGFISDQLMAVRRPGSQAMVSTSGSAVYPVPGAPDKLPWPDASADGKWVVWLIRNKDGSITSADVMTTTGGSLRTVEFPFAVDRTFPHAKLDTERRRLVVVGKAAGDTGSKIFVMPFDGGAPRVVAQVTGRVVNMRLSPDGSMILYDVEGEPTSTIYALDANAVVRVGEKR